jgi:hypothetical protein
MKENYVLLFFFILIFSERNPFNALFCPKKTQNTGATKLESVHNVDILWTDFLKNYYEGEKIR